MICSKCEVEQPEERFNWRYSRNGEKTHRRETCVTCLVEHNKQYRHKNRMEYNEQAKTRRHERKQRAIQYKGGVCEDCEQTYHWSAFDFHHIDATTKHKDPGLMMSTSDEILFKELDKCVLLCANCHRIRHFNEGY